ncbi:hypothetical protein [Streptomyces sp. NPDC001537]
MGGNWVEESLSVLQGTFIGHLPFAGEPLGHPTHLAGNPNRIADDCRRAEAAGCAGGLLAYRTTTDRLVIAGSIAGTEQIQALASAGADAFTTGSTAFDGSLQAHAGTLRSQLAPVLGLYQEPSPRTQKEGGAKRPASTGVVTASPAGMKRHPPVHEDRATSRAA